MGSDMIRTTGSEVPGEARGPHPENSAGGPSRRDFLRSCIAGGVGVVAGTATLPSLLTACDSPTGPPGHPSLERNRLRFAPEVAPQNLTLVAAEGRAGFGGEVEGPAWLLNGNLPSPLLRVRRGDPFQVVLENRLPQDVILHWHGLAPPADMDGHPRYAVGTGGEYSYAFTVEDRAGTYWYHSHTHMRTAEQTYRGVGRASVGGRRGRRCPGPAFGGSGDPGDPSGP